VAAAGRWKRLAHALRVRKEICVSVDVARPVISVLSNVYNVLLQQCSPSCHETAIV
jgi:hypothetical protein